MKEKYIVESLSADHIELQNYINKMWEKGYKLVSAQFVSAILRDGMVYEHSFQQAIFERIDND